MTDSIHTKLLIIGSGPAGWTAAIYAARANINPTIITGMNPGGQLTITTDVENYPGFGETIQGPWLMEQMEKQAAKVGTEIIHDHVSEVDLNVRPFTCKTDSGKHYTADSIVIATGAEARWLGIESEKKFRGFGVSGCATCDGFFFKGKEILVVGGGNTAVEEALYLTNFASKVILVHRRDELRAEKILQDKLFANKKVEIIWDHVVDEIIGEENPNRVTGIRIKHVKSNKIQQLNVEGIFIAIGHVPNTKLFSDQIKCDEENYIITANDSTKTNIEGVFAAGDVQDKIYRQAVTAAGTGCMAALEAEKYLANQ